MSKGSSRRPQQVPDKQFSDNWDRIFKEEPKESSKSKKKGEGKGKGK